MQLKEEGLGDLTIWGTVHQGREVMAAGFQGSWSHCIHSQEADSHKYSSSYSVQGPTHKTVPSTVKVTLPTPVNLV